MKNKFTVSISAILLALVLSVLGVSGQQIIFHKVDLLKGKNFGIVTGITQARNGYMWFTTKYGLYSYDGYQIVTHLHSFMNPNSIASNDLETIFADNDRNIWIGSLGAGLDRFDPATGLFTHFRHDIRDPNSISNDSVTAILRDKKGILWVGTYGGLDKVSADGRFTHYRHDPADKNTLSCNQIRSLYEDRQGTIWIGTGSPYPDNGSGPEEGGLNRLDIANNRITRYLHDPNNDQSLLDNKVRAIYEDNSGILWVGTGHNGLHRMDRTKGSFERIAYHSGNVQKIYGPIYTNKSPSYEQISVITQDAAGSFWIGSIEGGLNYFNPRIGKTINYNISQISTGVIKESGVWTAFSSRDGMLWISGSTPLGGNLFRVDPFHKEVEHTKSDWISSFYEEPGGIFWINGKDGELLRRDPKNGVTKKYKIISSSKEWIRIVTEDRNGNIWVGTSVGLKLWNKETETFTTYKNDPQNNRSLSFNMVHTLYADKDSNLWIGTNNGFNLRNAKTGLYTRYYLDPADTIERNGFTVNSISSIIRDKKNNLWVGSWVEGGGVYLFDTVTRKMKTYLKGIATSCIYEDAAGILWVGAINGLYKFDSRIDNFVRYQDQFLSAEISDASRMVEDNQNFLWIQTSEGLMRISPDRSEQMNFGISNTNFDFNSNCYKGRDGRLYFTEGSGYFSFYPTELTQGVKPPEIIFTQFGLGGQHIIPGTRNFLKQELSETEELKINYNQNNFSFEFAAIDFSDPGNTNHLYMLEPYDANWRAAGSLLKAYYFNVPPGDYVFRVKATISKGTSAQKKMKLIILPPWWLTWWAYGIYVLLFAAVAFTVYGIQKRRIIKAERQKNMQIELAQAKQIEKSYVELKSTQAQLIQSEKMASMGELTVGIAHEIQNPLNFVNNFSEINRELIDDLRKELTQGNNLQAFSIIDNIGENEQKIVDHGRRADAIVKSMLMHSRSRKGHKELIDINALVDEYFKLAYHDMESRDRSFRATMKMELDLGLGKITLMPQDIGSVLLNLYNNAFYEIAEKKKTLASEFEPIVTVSTEKAGGKLIVKVKDNGRGIPENIREKIFQPFFTTKPPGKGAGLGLSLSFDIVKAHGGMLTVNSKVGEYAEFILQLPM